MKITPFTFESLTGEENAAPANIIADGLVDAPFETVEEEVPSFSEEELESAKQESYDDGFLAGKKEGIREAEKAAQEKLDELQLVVKNVEQKLNFMQQDYQNALQTRQAELGKLVLTCADKLAGEALRKDPISDISEMIQSCLAGLFDSPEVIANVHPDIAPLLQDKLPKTVHINADETLQMGDCNLTWKHGQAMRDSAALWEELNTIITRHFTTQSQAEEVIAVEDTLMQSTPNEMATPPAAAQAPVEPLETPAAVQTTEGVESTPTETPSMTTEIEGENNHE